MNAPRDLTAAHRRFSTIGAALMRINANNTHSGNMSMRDPSDPDLFYVTASGSQCGALAPRDIVPVRLSDQRWFGDARPSSETNTHRSVLCLPGVSACVHCHAIASTLISFESRENPLFLSLRSPDRTNANDYLFQPVDFFGAGLIGGVRVGFYQRPVGSSEIEERITSCLRETPVTVVASHGPFARGRTLEECLHYLSVLENSSILAMVLKRRGVNITDIQRAVIEGGFEQVFPARPRAYEACLPTGCPETESSIAADFAVWLAYNFNFGLGAFGTGSMSRRVGTDQMIFCPMSAAPEGMDFPLYRSSLTAGVEEPHDLRLHRLIYSHTPFTACTLTTSPLATAEGMAVLAEAHGLGAGRASLKRNDDTCENQPVMAPIDAEAKYYQSRPGVVEVSSMTDESPGNPILTSLRGNARCCIIAGYGVAAVGEKDLQQAAYVASAVERTARFRQEAHLNQQLFGRPPVSEFE